MNKRKLTEELITLTDQVKVLLTKKAGPRLQYIFRSFWNWLTIGLSRMWRIVLGTGRRRKKEERCSVGSLVISYKLLSSLGQCDHGNTDWNKQGFLRLSHTSKDSHRQVLSLGLKISIKFCLWRIIKFTEIFVLLFLVHFIFVSLLLLTTKWKNAYCNKNISCKEGKKK